MFSFCNFFCNFLLQVIFLQHFFYKKCPCQLSLYLWKSKNQIFLLQDAGHLWPLRHLLLATKNLGLAFAFLILVGSRLKTRHKKEKSHTPPDKKMHRVSELKFSSFIQTLDHLTMLEVSITHFPKMSRRKSFGWKFSNAASFHAQQSTSLMQYLIKNGLRVHHKNI